MNINKYILILLSVPLIVIANNSGIKITGGTFKGKVYNHIGDVSLELVQNNTHNIRTSHITNSTTHNITTIIKNDPKLLKEFKRQFSSISNSSKRLENLNIEQKKLLKIIEAKLISQYNLSKKNQNILQKVLGTVQQLSMDTAYIKSVTSDTNLNTYQLIGITQEIQNNTNQIIHMQEQMLIEQQKLNKRMDEPEMKKAIQYRVGSCKRTSIKSINGVTFNTNGLNQVTYNTYTLDRDKVRCIGELYKSSHQNLSINLEHADRNTAQKFSDISGINMGNISYEGSKSNTVTVTTTYKPN